MPASWKTSPHGWRSESEFFEAERDLNTDRSHYGTPLRASPRSDPYLRVTTYGRPTASARRDLNHIFFPAGPRGTDLDYFDEGHVDARVVSDIALWVAKRK